MLWVYDPADGSLKRFATVPRGAEVTGPYITAEGTLFFSNQHPRATNLFPYNAGTVYVVNGFNANTDDFESMPVPEGDDMLRVMVAAGEAQMLVRSGDPIPNSIGAEIAGGIYDVNGDLMYVNNDPDGLMFLPVGSDGAQAWLYVNYEGIPGGVGRYFVQNTGMGWEVVDGQMVDFSDVMGTWTNCGSSVTPWNTGLTSEEYEPIASDFNNVSGMTDYLGRQANPYDYGWIVELAPNGLGDNVTKHYAMGRKSEENAWVAGDRRTVYFGDDGSNTVLFRFVADVEGDLSAGTLYAARVTQTGGTGAADHVFELEWLELGHATNDEVSAAIRDLDT
jgi:secreted PhoX family phosphatase